MKLSEAILKGCKIRPIKCRETYLRGKKCACVLGAAYVATEQSLVDCDEYTEIWASIEKEFKIVTHFAQHPIHELSDRVYDIMTDLNDNQGWSREKIAAWVASIEAQV